MRLVLILLTLTLNLCLLFGQDQNGFGKVDLQIDSGEGQTFNIRNALLYERASIDFDTTVQVQDRQGLLTYYYPQVFDGEGNILRFILTPEEEGERFYDLIINLDDSLQERIIFENDTGKVYFSRNGELIPFRRYTQDFSGTVLLLKGLQEKKMISGEMDISFALPLDEHAANFSTINMNGTFEVPVGEFRAVSLSATAPISKEKKSYKKNLYLAIIISALAILALGLQ